MIWLAGLASAAAWLWIIHRADRFQPEPLRTLLWVGLTGGFVSALVASALNAVVAALLGLPGGPTPGLSPSSAAVTGLFVGLDEESCKAIATVLLLRHLKQFDEPVDAVIYGMTIALVFAAIENIGYVGQGGMATLVARSLTSMPLHVGLAALWGAGIARARFGADGTWFRHVAPLVLLAAAIHALYDFALLSMGQVPVFAVLTLPCLAATLILARRIVRRLEQRSPFRPRTSCPSCRHRNPDGARFCARCGTALVGGIPAPDPSS